MFSVCCCWTLPLRSILQTQRELLHKKDAIEEDTGTEDALSSALGIRIVYRLETTSSAPVFCCCLSLSELIRTDARHARRVRTLMCIIATTCNRTATATAAAAGRRRGDGASGIIGAASGG